MSARNEEERYGENEKIMKYDNVIYIDTIRNDE